MDATVNQAMEKTHLPGKTATIKKVADFLYIRLTSKITYTFVHRYALIPFKGHLFELLVLLIVIWKTMCLSVRFLK